MKYTIPLFRPYFDSVERKLVDEVLSSGWVTQGPTLKRFEKAVADYTGAKHAIAVANCTCALHLALLSVGVSKSDEVIVADMSYPATAHAVLHCGAKPIFCDIAPLTFNINPSSIEPLISKRTKAIIPVHTFGQVCDMAPILKIAKKYKLAVIEDAACALGAKYGSRQAGTLADAGCFSFHARKGITTGEGGMIVTDNARLAAKVRRLSMFGAVPKASSRKYRFSLPDFTSAGYNYKMSDISAAIGLAQLGKLDKIIAKKRKLAAYWNGALSRIKHITTPFAAPFAYHIYQSYVILLDGSVQRNAVINELAQKGIQANIGTYAMHKQKVYRSRQNLPCSLYAFNNALALPIFYSLKEEQIDHTAAVLKQILEG